MSIINQPRPRILMFYSRISDSRYDVVNMSAMATYKKNNLNLISTQ